MSKYTTDDYEDFEMSDAFRAAWAKKEALGYHYGRDALEGVRFGFEIAEETLTAERDQLRAQSESWRVAHNAWQTWATEMLGDGTCGDEVARNRMQTERDQLRTALIEACEMGIRVVTAGWVTPSTDSERFAELRLLAEAGQK